MFLILCSKNETIFLNFNVKSSQINSDKNLISLVYALNFLLTFRSNKGKGENFIRIFTGFAKLILHTN
jgi:hypothetical protein